jgi:hypothetical protein
MKTLALIAESSGVLNCYILIDPPHPAGTFRLHGHLDLVVWCAGEVQYAGRYHACGPAADTACGP